MMVDLVVGTDESDELSNLMFAWLGVAGLMEGCGVGVLTGQRGAQIGGRDADRIGLGIDEGVTGTSGGCELE
jgi:hypothetical protein